MFVSVIWEICLTICKIIKWQAEQLEDCSAEVSVAGRMLIWEVCRGIRERLLENIEQVCP